MAGSHPSFFVWPIVEPILCSIHLPKTTGALRVANNNQWILLRPAGISTDKKSESLFPFFDQEKAVSKSSCPGAYSISDQSHQRSIYHPQRSPCKDTESLEILSTKLLYRHLHHPQGLFCTSDSTFSEISKATLSRNSVQIDYLAVVNYWHPWVFSCPSRRSFDLSHISFHFTGHWPRLPACPLTPAVTHDTDVSHFCGDIGYI